MISLTEISTLRLYMQIIYPDNSIVRLLSDNPEAWNTIYDQIIRKFGRGFRTVQSYYLFFEYIGFTKETLEIPSIFMKPNFDDIARLAAMDLASNICANEITILDKNLKKVEDDITAHIRRKLPSLKPLLKTLIEERMKRTTPFEKVQRFVDSLFGNIFSLIEQDFDTFAENATTCLSWDVFCGINPLGLSLKIIRERQLGYWLRNWKQGIKLPLGKIIDDQSSYYAMDFTSHFKECEDMVDSEMHTLLILGYEIDEHIHPIHCITHPPKDKSAISKRNELTLASIDNIEKSLSEEIRKFPGKIHSIDRVTHQITETHEPMFLITL